VDSTLFAPLGGPPLVFLAATAIGGLFAVNAYRPLARGGALSVSVFFAGWLTAELPLQHLAWQLVATAVLVRAGALAAWPGWVGLGIALASWAALLNLFVRARDAGDVLEAALSLGLGGGYRGRIAAEWLARLDPRPSMVQLVMPFAFGHRDVERVRDVAYGAFGRRNRLDVYRPRDRRSGCPVLIEVHGGAWIIGNKEQQALPLIYHLASQGWVCVAINYRLSPRSTFPDHIVDVKRAIAWVKANIAEYGGDPGFVVITGGSAGGHLSSLAALTAGDPAFQPGFEGADTAVSACVPFYGVYDFTNREGVGRDDTIGLLERLVFKRRLSDAREVFDQASPMSRITDRAPPFLVIHGVNDTLVPVAEARLFVELLRRSSRAPVVYAELPHAQHAFEVFASVRTAHVIRGVARFLAYVYSEHLRALERPALAAGSGLPAGLAAKGAPAEVAATAS
jgi:acetyl esterase/lipase